MNADIIPAHTSELARASLEKDKYVSAMRMQAEPKNDSKFDDRELGVKRLIRNSMARVEG
jgi:hypothetical protein